METFLEQGLLQLPQLLRDQASRYQEQWRALDQRLQQRLDALEARVALHLESLKGDVVKASNTSVSYCARASQQPYLGPDPFNQIEQLVLPWKKKKKKKRNEVAMETRTRQNKRGKVQSLKKKFNR